MKLKCVRHDRRVQVIDMGADSFGIPVALTVHRNGGKTNDVCDSNSLTIGKEFFTPIEVLAFPYDEANTDTIDDNTDYDAIVDAFLNDKRDLLIYS